MSKPSHHYERDFPNIERIRLGAKALIVHEGKILVIKERIKYNGELVIVHDLPGGGIDLGEKPTDGLKREVLEEVGLSVQIEKLVGTWDFVVPKRTNPDAALHIVCLGYQCAVDGAVSIDTTQNPAEEDIFETAWLTKDEILNSNDEIFPLEDMQAAVAAVTD